VVLKDGANFMSLVEAFWYIEFKKLGLKFSCESKYPGGKIGRSRYDFYFPSLNLYVEVTGYGKEWGHWKRYIDIIKRKKDYVEKSLKANFLFIPHNLSDSERAVVRRNLKTN
jgi:hypothetical protein